MEIIHLVLGKANPDRMNGVNKVVYQLASRQASTGRSVSVWGITADLNHNYGERNFETKLFKAHKNPFSLDKELKIAIISQKGKAVFHLHGGWIPTYSTIARLLSKHEIPYVITGHGAYNKVAMLQSKWFKKIYFQLFEKQLLKHSHRIHSIGESEVLGLNSIFPNDKSFLMPYGFELPTTIPENSDISSDFIIGYMGRIDIHTKGLDLLLKAFNQFQKQEINSKLWIVGDGGQRTELEKMIADLNVQNVVMWGSKFGNEKNDILAQMQVFTHPSRNEGLPSAVLEAASFGVPAIVTNATNVGAYVQEFKAGIQIDNENADALYAALINLKKEYNLGNGNTFANNAKRMVTEAFSWDNLVVKFDKLYQ